MRGRGPQPPAGRDRAPARGGSALQGRRIGRRQGGRSRMAGLAGREAARACARQRHHRVHRDGRRGGPAERRAAAARHRRPAHGRHERGRRPVRVGQDVPAAGGEIGPRHEGGRRLSHALHGGREGGFRPRRAFGRRQDRHGDGQGRRARYRQEHRRRRARLQQLRGHRSRRHGAGAEDSRHGAPRERRPDRPVRA